MKKCIVINGVSGAGKDTFINWFNYFSEYKTYNISSVELVKDIMKKYTSWNGEAKNLHIRNCMASLKQALIDFDNTPLNYLLASYELMEEGIMFMHVREPSEIDKLKETIPDLTTILIDIDRKSIVENDQEVYDYQYDYYVYNDYKLDRFLESVKLVYTEIYETF